MNLFNCKRDFIAFDTLKLLFSPSLEQRNRIIGESGARKYFRDHQTSNTIRLFVSTKGNFSGIFF